jgi:hypothetical protein
MNKKFTIPTKYDEAPCGYLWKVPNDSGINDIYIQLSADATKPDWQRLGYVIEIAFDGFWDDSDFIDECLRLYRYNNMKPKVSDIEKRIKERIES